MIFKLFFGIGVIYSVFEEIIYSFKGDSVMGFIEGCSTDVDSFNKNLVDIEFEEDEGDPEDLTE